MDTIQPVRGTSDLLPAEKAKHNYVIEHAKQGAGQFGYADMYTPIFEFTDVFSRPLGASSDVVAKETYSFEDRGGTGLTLRPEGTAAAMRPYFQRADPKLAPALVLCWSDVQI